MATAATLEAIAEAPEPVVVKRGREALTVARAILPHIKQSDCIEIDGTTIASLEDGEVVTWQDHRKGFELWLPYEEGYKIFRHTGGILYAQNKVEFLGCAVEFVLDCGEDQ